MWVQSASKKVSFCLIVLARVAAATLAVVVSPSSIVAAFDHSTDSLLARTLECRRESHTLAALRDALLPKLISGELRVKDAERVLDIV